MKTLTKLLIGGFSVIAISFLVPEYQDSPKSTEENLVEIRLNASSEKLLLRTEKHDYEFLLPPNNLSEVLFLPPNNEASPLLPTGLNRTFFSPLRVDPNGAVSMNFMVRFGGYNPRLSETKTILSSGMRRHLEKLGFVPSNGNFSEDNQPALYMVWEHDLVGRQYPALSRDSSSGKAVKEPCCSPSRIIHVVEDDTAKLARHRKINTALTPFHAIKNGVSNFIGIIAVIFILLFT